MFRFTNESHSKPKGRPVSLLDADITLASRDDGVCCLKISSVRKTQVIRCPTEEVRNQWLASLRAAKQHAIKVKLGHAQETRSDLAARELGSAIITRKDKEQEESEKMQTQLMQDATFASKMTW